MSGARDGRTGRLVGGVPRVPDGCVVLPGRRRIAVELECSPKWGNRYGVVLRYYAAGAFNAMRWFVEVATLRKRLTDLVARELVDDLIPVLGATELSRGRRVSADDCESYVGWAVRRLRTTPCGSGAPRISAALPPSTSSMNSMVVRYSMSA